ncbi:MAG: hypothetical protein AAGJ08_16165 [Cyanobacteria bacterium P01_H01_bin.35]
MSIKTRDLAKKGHKYLKLNNLGEEKAIAWGRAAGGDRLKNGYNTL